MITIASIIKILYDSKKYWVCRDDLEVLWFIFLCDLATIGFTYLIVR